MQESEQHESIELEERALNVLREADDHTLTTPQIAEQLPIGSRATQKHIRELEKKGRVILKTEGRPNHWTLSETEPTEPIYREEYAVARRTANKASEVGNKLFLLGVSVLAAIGFITTSNIYAQGYQIPIPVLRETSTVMIGGVVGLLGIGLFLAAFIANFVAIALPRAVERYIGGRVPNEDK